MNLQQELHVSPNGESKLQVMNLEQTEMFTRQDDQNHTYGAAACDNKCGFGIMGTVNLCLKFG